MTGARESPPTSFLGNLEKTSKPDRRVLLCVHKPMEHIALSYEPSFGTYSVAHRGAIDGRNDWNDYDTVVIFGLSYRDQIWATNTFFALQGLQDNRWLEQPSWGRLRGRATGDAAPPAHGVGDPGREPCAVSPGDRRRGRIARRPMYSSCYLVGTDGDAILVHLQDEMPGAVVVPWDFEMDGPSERVRRGSFHEALVALMGNRLPEEAQDVVHFQSELGITPSAVKKLRKVLRDDSHHLTKSLAEVGVRYLTSGMGRSSRSFLLKR